jgi:polyisoprenoid-binding protein YceI
MKKIFMTLSAVLVATSIAFATPLNTTEKTTEKTVKAVEKKVVDTEASKITWKAYKVTGSHEGTINLASGNLDFNGTTLTGGAFVVDMTTINTTDLEGEYKQKLDGHLHSDDFFGTATHKTASLEITSVKASGKNAYDATAKLTIKNITKEVNFTISVYGSKATASLKVDRSEFDVRYGSGSFFDNLGDKTIYDEFDLVVDLQF